MQLDKDAANRFIKAALAEATRNEEKELRQFGVNGSTDPFKQVVNGQPLLPDGGAHTRFKQAQDDEGAHSDSSSSISGGELSSRKPPTEEMKKRKRPVLDPFTGKHAHKL